MKKFIILLFLIFITNLLFSQDISEENLEEQDSPDTIEKEGKSVFPRERKFYFSIGEEAGFTVPVDDYSEIMNIGSIVCSTFNFYLNYNKISVGFGLVAGAMNSSSINSYLYEFNMNIFPILLNSKIHVNFNRFFLSADLNGGLGIISIKYNQSYWGVDDRVDCSLMFLSGIGFGFYINSRLSLSLNENFIFISFEESPFLAMGTVFKLEIYF